MYAIFFNFTRVYFVTGSMLVVYSFPTFVGELINYVMSTFHNFLLIIHWCCQYITKNCWTSI